MKKLLFLLLMVINGVCYGHIYKARIDIAEWHLEPSSMQCRLWQAIPHYGTAVFEARAGQKLQFYLDTLRPFPVQGEVRVEVWSPFWRSGLIPEPMTTVNVSEGRRPITLGQRYALRLLDELINGMMPAFAMQSIDHPVTVAVSPVNFGEAYQGLLACLADLFPANFEQLQNTYVLFDTDKYHIVGETKRLLDLVARYLTSASDPIKVSIYGHTDNVGTRGYNWGLSKRRAVSVRRYLIKKGVDASSISFKYYGETRPRVRNNNDHNRHKNRRVLVRLERG